MLQVAIYVALVVAGCSALLGSRTAWVLVPLVGACLLSSVYGIAFQQEVWFGMDVAAIVLIVGLQKLDRQSWAILLLFPCAWPLYLAPDPYRYFGSATITILQLLLTFPAGEAWQVLCRLGARWKANFRHRHEWTDLESREAHG